MQNRCVVVLCNLKPVKMRGIESQAMVLCGSTPEKVEFLDPPLNCVPGDRVSCPGYAGIPDTLLNPKKKVWETVQSDLLVNAEGFASYKGILLEVSDKGKLTTRTLRNVMIK
ncbi:unnamed protein product [Soboliphyme baturini]|uniref:tRNA-binding domain-containing protein n=1 Tax=Soboliphyme baturini TaxID=241478 RepID=A0A183IW68_9BILA|nr:unnamed protein product [Soboliphyme baturini]